MMNRRNNMLATYNPFREMDEFERRFFGQPFGGFPEMPGLAEFKTDIKDEGENFLLESDLPGFAKEDISLDVDGDILTIKAERHSEHEDSDKKGKYVRCERSYGSYSRQFDISAVDSEGIKATYADGVLSLTLPKKANLLPEKRHLAIE